MSAVHLQFCVSLVVIIVAPAALSPSLSYHINHFKDELDELCSVSELPIKIVRQLDPTAT
jgi:hypothetical protein